LVQTTNETIRDLEAARQRWEEEESLFGEGISKKRFEMETALALERWAERVTRLGVYPKGYFTCDFQSPDPETLFCWTYGEDRVNHTHKVWESFKDRRLILDAWSYGYRTILN